MQEKIIKAWEYKNWGIKLNCYFLCKVNEKGKKKSIFFNTMCAKWVDLKQTNNFFHKVVTPLNLKTLKVFHHQIIKKKIGFKLQQ